MVSTRTSFAGLAAFCAVLSACDIPTSAPKAPLYDTEWNIPSKSDTIAVDSLLPKDNSIRVNATKTAFLLTVSAVNTFRQLGLDCAACAAGTGTTIPKPAFSTTASATATLPAKLVTATLSAGDTLTLTLTNNYTFDPLKPSNPVVDNTAGNCWKGQSTGYLVTTITSGGVVVGKDSINGATQTFFGTTKTLVRPVVLVGNVAQSTGLLVTSTLCSPPAGNVAMDASKTFAASGTVGNSFGVGSASIVVNAQTVNSAPSAVDLSSMSNAMVNHTKSGKMTLTIANPFSVAGSLTVNVSGAGTAIAPKSITIAATASALTDTISFTGAELQSMFGHSVTLSIGGSVSQTGASVTVHPADLLVMSTRLDVLISTQCQLASGSC